MVEDVERIGPEIQVEPIPEVKLPADGRVDFRQTESWNVVPALRPLTYRQRDRKSGGVETPTSGCVGICNPIGLAGDSVGAQVRSADSCGSDDAVEWKSASRNHESLDRPVFSRSADDSLSRHFGDRDGHRTGKAVTHVEA